MPHIIFVLFVRNTPIHKFIKAFWAKFLPEQSYCTANEKGLFRAKYGAFGRAKSSLRNLTINAPVVPAQWLRACLIIKKTRALIHPYVSLYFSPYLCVSLNKSLTVVHDNSFFSLIDAWLCKNNVKTHNMKKQNLVQNTSYYLTYISSEQHVTFSA